MTESSRSTFQLTVAADDIAGRLQDSLPFDDKMDVARIGFSYAVAHGLAANQDEHKLGRLSRATYAVGSFDRTGEMQALIRVLYPQVTDAAEALFTLVNRGLEALATASAAFSVSELLNTALTSIERDEATSS